jgi:hypothetical protein
MAYDQTFNVGAEADDGYCSWGENPYNSPWYGEGYDNSSALLYAGRAYYDFGGGWDLHIIFEANVRFTSVSVPKGSKITNAKITLTTIDSGACTGTPDLDIQAFDEDNSSQISSFGDFQGRSRTTANIRWNRTFSDNTAYETPDISSVVQEIVDRSGWASGNAMQFVISDHTYKYPTHDMTYSDGIAFDSDAVTNISINIDYTYEDSGLRIYKGGVKKVGCYTSASGRTSKLRTYKGSVKHIAFDSNLDSGLRIHDGSTAQVVATAD